MEKKERDIGFFNGIKAELIPLGVGLASFTLLADQAINQLGSFFSLGDKEGIWLFIFIYFIAPVILIIVWLALVNHNDGLKERLLKNWTSPKSIFVWLITIGILLSPLAIFLLSVKNYLVLALIIFVFILFYLGFVVWSESRKNYSLERELRQARVQMGTLVACLMVVWWFYFFNMISYGEFKTEWEEDGGSLITSIDQGAFVRKEHEATMSASSKLTNHLRDFTMLPRDERLGNYGLRWEAVKNELWENFRITFRKNNEPIQLREIFTEMVSAKKLDTDSLQYVINRVQAESLQTYKHQWAPWLRTVQFKGLLLFNLLMFFLLVIWYHSYTSQLLTNDSSEYSETSISKISIYFLFLLIIPFFKPFKEDTISFGKPYLGNGTSIGSIINNKYDVEQKPCVCPEQQKFDYGEAAMRVKDSLKKQLQIINKLETQIDQTKKYPQKQ